MAYIVLRKNPRLVSFVSFVSFGNVAGADVLRHVLMNSALSHDSYMSARRPYLDLVNEYTKLLARKSNLNM